MKSIKKILLCFALLNSLSSSIFAQFGEDSGKDLLDQNVKGMDLLSKALELHGDIEDTNLQIALTIVADQGIHRGQSLTAEPPFERYKFETYFYIDRINKLEAIQNKNRFAGFEFINTIIADHDDIRNYEHNTKTYTSATSVGFNNYRYFPHTYLQQAIASPLNVSYQGTYYEHGKTYHHIATYIGGVRKVLFINAETGLLHKVESLRNYPPYGDGVQTIEFDDYVQYGPIHIPSITRSGGDYGVWKNSTNEYVISIEDFSTARKINHADMIDYQMPDYSYRLNSEVRKIADNIYIIENITDSKRQWSYNILFAELANSVLVAEAPLNNNVSKEAIEIIKSTIPGKPIKYLVQSHHHNDHWGGIREYMSINAKMITSPGIVDLLQAISTAPFRLNPDDQLANPTPVAIEAVQKQLVLDDKRERVEIYDIGPTVHANEMLVIYFPNKKILWQADMVNYGEWSIGNRLKYQLLSKIKELDLDAQKIVGVHGKIVEVEELVE